MQVKETQSKGLNREYEVLVTAKEIEESVEKRLKAIGSNAKIPGFRPGKAPLPILKQRYQAEAISKALEDLIEKGIQKIAADHKIRPALQPKVEVKSFEEGKDLVFVAQVEVFPALEDLKIDNLAFKKYVIKVPEKEVTEFLERIAKQTRETRTLEKPRKSQKGDVVVIDFKGYIDEKPIEGGAGKDHKLELGSGSFIQGFEDQLIGHDKGADVIVKVTFPKEYHEQRYASKPARFDVKIHDIHEIIPMKVDKALADKLGFETFEKMRETIEKDIAHNYESKGFLSTKRQVLDALSERFTFDVPPSMVQMEYENIWGQLCREVGVAKEPAANENAKEREKAFLDSTERSEAQLQKEYHTIAERRVRLGILLAEIGNRNKISVSQQELLNAVIEKAREYPGQEKEVFEFYRKNESALSSLRAPLFENKVIDYILGQSKITEKTLSPEELEELLIREEEEAEEKITSHTKKPQTKEKTKAPQKDTKKE